MNFFLVFKKIIQRVRKMRFIKGFQAFDISSGIGKNCVFEGKENICVGKECNFGPNCHIISYSNNFSENVHSELTFGNFVRITSSCRITCAKKIKIGNNVLMGPEVMITDHNHGMNPLIADGYSKQSLLIGEVKIGDGVWLGQRVIILPNVTIGDHAIIGAGSIVTKSVPAYCIAVGNPAKVIKKWNFEKKEWTRYYE